MNAELLHNALDDLSDELLLEVNALRQPGKRHWGRWAALAACLCLVIGIGISLPQSQPGSITETAPVSVDKQPETADAPESIISSNSFRAQVLEVKKDHLVVRVTAGDDRFEAGRILQLDPPTEASQLQHFAPGDAVVVFYSGISTHSDADSIHALGIVPDESGKELS